MELAQTAVARRSGETSPGAKNEYGLVVVLERESLGGMKAQTAVARWSGESTGAVSMGGGRWGIIIHTLTPISGVKNGW